MKPIILALSGNETLAQSLANNLATEVGELIARRFPDGESYVRIETPLQGQDVIIACTLHHPDEKILPLFFIAETAKDLGAKRIGLVAPYLAYMRQDRRFQPGEGITSTYFAKFISSCIDWLVTVDPHLHRRSSLEEIYQVPCKIVHAAPMISDWIKTNMDMPVLVGPDIESDQWVAAVANGADAPYLVLEKTRHGDRDVEISVPDVERWRNRTPVLVDDIISTARTMIETVHHLKRAGLNPPICIGVHGVFADHAYDDLLEAGVAKVITCNTIPHATNAIDLGSHLVDAILRMH
jgi:ribose-phosphate pyrophosphokinase